MSGKLKQYHDPVYAQAYLHALGEVCAFPYVAEQLDGSGWTRMVTGNALSAVRRYLRRCDLVVPSNFTQMMLLLKQHGYTTVRARAQFWGPTQRVIFGPECDCVTPMSKPGP